MNGLSHSKDGLSRRSVMTMMAMGGGAAWIGVSTDAAVAQRASDGRPNPTVIDDLVVANRILVDKGFLDTAGHVSVRDDRNPNRYLMSWRRAPELITPDDILVHDLDSNVADAKGHPLYQERFIHGEIYKARPDVNAIVHGHTPAIVAFSSSNIPLQPVIAGANFVGQGVPTFKNGDAGGGVGNAELGRGLAQALGKSGAVLMRGHGVVVVGATLPSLVQRANNLDINAQIQSRILSMGDKPLYLHPPENAGAGAGDNGREWEAWKRRVMSLMNSK